MRKILIEVFVLVILIGVICLMLVRGDYPIQIEGSTMIITQEVGDWIRVQDYHFRPSATVTRKMKDGTSCTYKEYIGTEITEVIIDRRNR